MQHDALVGCMSCKQLKYITRQTDKQFYEITLSNVIFNNSELIATSQTYVFSNLYDITQGEHQPQYEELLYIQPSTQP